MVFEQQFKPGPDTHVNLFKVKVDYLDALAVEQFLIFIVYQNYKKKPKAIIAVRNYWFGYVDHVVQSLFKKTVEN